MGTDVLDPPGDDENNDDDDLELPDLDLPESEEVELLEGKLLTEEEVLERLKSTEIVQPIYEHPNPDVRTLDDILRNVGWRNSVYADEILKQLPDNPYSEHVHNELSKHVAHIPDGDKLLHSREYLDILLDYRNILTAGDEEQLKEEISV